MLAKTLFSLFLIATSSLLVRAEEVAEGSALIEAGDQGKGRDCEPRKDKECLGLCECPKEWNSYITLVNQVQCQEVLQHGCPRSLIVPVHDTRKCAEQSPFLDIDAIRITFNKVCISNHIFVRPHCQYPICLRSIITAFLENPNEAFAAALAVVESGAEALNIGASDEWLARIEAAILSVRGIIFEDGGLGVAGYLTTPDCHHECKPGFSAALEIIVRAVGEDL